MPRGERAADSSGATKNDLWPKAKGAKRDDRALGVVCPFIRVAGWARAVPDRSGRREPTQEFTEAESISDSSPVEARGQVKGSPATPEGWLRRKRAFKSKGSSNAPMGEPPSPLAMADDFTKDKREALRASPDRRADSLAVTGLIQPWSSVEARDVDPAPVKASGPVHSMCWVEGADGPRRWSKFRRLKAHPPIWALALRPPHTFSSPGRPVGSGVVKRCLSALVWTSSPSVT